MVVVIVENGGGCDKGIGGNNSNSRLAMMVVTMALQENGHK